MCPKLSSFSQKRLSIKNNEVGLSRGVENTYKSLIRKQRLLMESVILLEDWIKLELSLSSKKFSPVFDRKNLFSS